MMEPLSRRELLGGVVAASTMKTINVTARPVWPHKIAPGAKVAVVAPSGGEPDPKNVEDGLQAIRDFGYVPTLGPNSGGKIGFLAARDDQRRSDLMWAFTDPDFEAVICLRGGYGAARILPDLDYDLIRRSRRPLIGFSDITALHLALLARANLVSFHGPCATSSFNDFSNSWMHDALESRTLTTLKNPEGKPIEVLSAGKAKGKLIGGNLAVFLSLFGTPYMPKLDGAILYFEDVSEASYRVDRMLTTLRIAGALHRAAGIVFGQFTKDEDSDPAVPSVLEVINERTAGLGIPVIANCQFGHVREKWTIPCGADAVLDGDSLSYISPK